MKDFTKKPGWQIRLVETLIWVVYPFLDGWEIDPKLYYTFAVIWMVWMVYSMFSRIPAIRYPSASRGVIMPIYFISLEPTPFNIVSILVFISYAIYVFKPFIAKMQQEEMPH